MYLILASQVDENAIDLLPHFPKGTVQLLTPRDLSKPGWQVHSTNPTFAQGVAGGRKFHSKELTGVVTLLPAIFPQELIQITQDDRDYVAAEMTAFLKYWLATLPCPVLNPPTAGSLTGPNWRMERWWLIAKEAGLPVSPYCLGNGPSIPQDDLPNSMVEITLVGGRSEADAKSELVEMALCLAEKVALPLLSVTFSRQQDRGYIFNSANAIPKLSGEGIVRLLLDYFTCRKDLG